MKRTELISMLIVSAAGLTALFSGMIKGVPSALEIIIFASLFFPLYAYLNSKWGTGEKKDERYLYLHRKVSSRSIEISFVLFMLCFAYSDSYLFGKRIGDLWGWLILFIYNGVYGAAGLIITRGED